MNQLREEEKTQKRRDSDDNEKMIEKKPPVSIKEADKSISSSSTAEEKGVHTTPGST